MPRLDFWFRLFHHASLGLASVCLLYAEAFFLPDPLLLALYGTAGLQVLAFGADGGRWVLPSWAANLLAGAVAGGGAVWIAVQLSQPDSVLANLPLPAGLLPYIGPILIGLLVVKLFRPRTRRDFWLLQGVGALQVALACVLATNPESGLLFGLLLAAYVACALGCLTLHYFREEQTGKNAPRTPRPATAVDRLPFSYLLAPFCLRWVLATAALAAPLYLLTPRFDGAAWDSAVLMSSGRRPDPPAGAVGFSQSIDLNRNGTVRLSEEEAFHVAVAAPVGRPLPTLPADQRWRGGVLDSYQQGHWWNQEETAPGPVEVRRPPPSVPVRPPGRFSLDFTVHPHAGGCFLAEPVRTSGNKAYRTAVDSRDPKRPGPQVVSSRGLVLPILYAGLREYHYRQTAVAGDDPDHLPADVDLFYRDPLTREEVAGLAEWTAKLLARLAAVPTSGLTAADAPPAADRPGAAPALPVSSWERVGKALANHLGHSGEYGYTLDLRRQDATLDPVMDFLVHVKRGHCERFASALALMLRSQRIPARVVVGFRGAFPQEEGVYSVRENQAHAWVEMLTAHETVAGLGASTLGMLGNSQGQGPLLAAAALFPERTGAEWVTLDPTPAGDLAPPPYSLWDWWQDGQRTGQELWGGLVVNYNADEQAGLWAKLQSPRVLTGLMEVGLALPALVPVAALTYVGLRWRRGARRAGPTAASPAGMLYARLLVLLARRARLRPRPNQTPREFAAQARDLLRSLPAAAALEDLPDHIVDLLYGVRYGAGTLAEGQATAVAARLRELAAVNFSLSP